MSHAMTYLKSTSINNSLLARSAWAPTLTPPLTDLLCHLTQDLPSGNDSCLTEPSGGFSQCLPHREYQLGFTVDHLPSAEGGSRMLLEADRGRRRGVLSTAKSVLPSLTAAGTIWRLLREGASRSRNCRPHDFRHSFLLHLGHKRVVKTQMRQTGFLSGDHS